VNSAASLAAGLPVGRHAVRLGVLAAYAAPAAAVWALLGLVLTATRLTGLALAAVVGYACCYGAIEVWGRRGVRPPGRAWQVPQSMMIEASPRRRVLIWGAILGPGLATRNPLAGFGLLPLAVAAMGGTGAGIALGVAIGLAHGSARAVTLLRDVRQLSPAQGARGPAADASGGSAPDVLTTHLHLVLKTVYWQRLDGAVLLAAAATGFAACLRYFT
jgi:hypothetical protein